MTFKERREGVDYAKLIVSEFNQGYMLFIMLNNISMREYLAIRNEKVEIRLFIQDGHVIPLISFGANLIFEMIPTLSYPDGRLFQMKDVNNMLTVILVEGINDIVKHIRMANLPKKFIEKCSKIWANEILKIDADITYFNWSNEIQSKYSIEKLWDMSEKAGHLGEMYEL